MSCILNINRFIIPNDVILTLTEIYQFIGKNESYQKIVASDKNRMIEQTIARDCYFLAKMTHVELTDARMRLIITKDSSPRTRDEILLFNLKELLTSCQYRYKTMMTQSNDLVNMANFLYQGQNIRFDYVAQDKKAVLQSQNMRSKRMDLDEMDQEVSRLVEREEYETIVLYLNYFIDFYNLAPFTEANELSAYLLLYLLMMKANVHAFSYVSLFELLYNAYPEFLTELKNASFNWKEGYAQTLGFVRFMLKVMVQAYKRADEIIHEFEYDQNLNKANNIENTINKLQGIFTKEDIRRFHPYVSESTINRALNKMKDENQIKPLSKGRSAKWIKNP
ncbi:MAG: hypothetical protein PHY42_05750 [Bacilli bacterium]|nr:hypothetical protein [Bacilli bacterium]